MGGGVILRNPTDKHIESSFRSHPIMTVLGGDLSLLVSPGVESYIKSVGVLPPEQAYFVFAPIQHVSSVCGLSILHISLVVRSTRHNFLIISL